MRFVPVLLVYTASPDFLNTFEESCFSSPSTGSTLTPFDRSSVYPSTIAPAMSVGSSVPVGANRCYSYFLAARYFQRCGQCQLLIPTSLTMYLSDSHKAFCFPQRQHAAPSPSFVQSQLLLESLGACLLSRSNLSLSLGLCPRDHT